MTSFTVLCCLQMSEGCLRSFSRGIWVLLIDLFKVWMRIRVYGSAQALYCVANTLYWKSFKRQIFTHLTVLKHQNTKTSLNKLSKNHWVIAIFEIFGSVRKKLQFTVFNDHPVKSSRNLIIEQKLAVSVWPCLIYVFNGTISNRISVQLLKTSENNLTLLMWPWPVRMVEWWRHTESSL